MNNDTSLSELPWRCPRCKRSRCYVAVETGALSGIQYEVMICDNCAHVEHRAADLDVVAALAAGGLRGVRHVTFPPEAQASTWYGGSDALAVDPTPESVSVPGNDAAVIAAADVMPPTLREIASPLPFSVTESLDRTTAQLHAKLDSLPTAKPVGGSGGKLTRLLVIAGLGVAAWLVFGREEAPDASAPAPTVAVSAAPAIFVADLPGAPHAIDPGTIIDQARRASGLGSNAVLKQIEGVFVGSKGTVDLDNPHYKGRMVYRFEGKTDAPKAPARPEGIPLGAPGIDAPPSAMYHYRAVLVDMNGSRIVERRDWPLNQSQRLAQEVLPHCSFAQVWEAARSGDAPADAVATVTYTIDNNKPHWWFAIRDTPFGFTINPATCTRY